MHKMIPISQFEVEDPVFFLENTIPNWESLGPYERERLVQLHIQMRAEQRKNGGLPALRDLTLTPINPVGDGHFMHTDGELHSNHELGRVISTNGDNMLLPEIQQQYPQFINFFIQTNHPFV